MIVLGLVEFDSHTLSSCSKRLSTLVIFTTPGFCRSRTRGCAACSGWSYSSPPTSASTCQPRPSSSRLITASCCCLPFAFNYVVVCAHMAQKGELFGVSVVAHPSTFNTYIGPFSTWLGYYLLTCAASMLIAEVPMKFGPDIF